MGGKVVGEGDMKVHTEQVFTSLDAATPASTPVQVVKLARPEFSLEIEVAAKIPNTARPVPTT